jgi:hypothetical protein
MDALDNVLADLVLLELDAQASSSATLAALVSA